MSLFKVLAVILTLSLAALFIPAAIAQEGGNQQEGMGAILAGLQNVSGTVTITDSDDGMGRSNMAHIMLMNVPQLPPGFAYEGWFVSDDGSIKKSTGLLSVDANGNVSHTFTMSAYGMMPDDDMMMTGDDAMMMTGDDAMMMTGDDAMMMTGDDAMMMTGDDAMMMTGDDDMMMTGDDAMMMTGDDAMMMTGDDAMMMTGDDAMMKTGDDAMMKTGDDAMMMTGDDAMMKTGDDAMMMTGDDAMMKTGDDAMMKTGDDAMMKTGDDAMMKTGDDAMMKTGDGMMPGDGMMMPAHGGNLFAGFDKFVVTIEPVPDDDPGPSEVIALIGQLDSGVLAQVRSLLVSYAGMANGSTAGLMEQTEVALMHARLANEAKGLEAIQAHAEHVVNIIEGMNGENYGDLNGDGTVEDPGDQMGVLGYANAVKDQAMQAMAASSDDAMMMTSGAEEVVQAADEAIARATDARDVAIRALGASDELAASILIDPSAGFLEASLEASGNVHLEAHKIGTYRVMMAPQPAPTPTPTIAPTPTPPQTPDPTPTPAPPAPGDPVVPGMAKLALFAGISLLGAGALLLLVRTFAFRPGRRQA